MSLSSKILEIVAQRPGVTDRELTTTLFSASKHPSQVNQECRFLAQRGALVRRTENGAIRNYPAAASQPPMPSPEAHADLAEAKLSEDDVKRHVMAWLEAAGWSVEVKWGKAPGIDILARRGAEKWIIEAKGCGSLPAMRVNYFLSMIGETLQRMDDPDAHYSIALPRMTQYEGLWRRLPSLAKSRTGITMLFVTDDGHVSEIDG